MAPTYEWRHENGSVVETDEPSTPPDTSGKWERVFSFGISTVNGAGGSPSRPTVSRSSTSS